MPHLPQPSLPVSPPAVDAASQWKCWFPSFFLRFVSSPVYIINFDIDPTALVIGQQLENYSKNTWQCVIGIAQARGSKPFCSPAPSAAAAVNAGPVTTRAGTSSWAVAKAAAAAAATSTNVDRVERSLRSVARRRGGGGHRSNTTVDDGSIIDYSGGIGSSQPNDHAGIEPIPSSSCPGGAETAVDAYGQHVCKRINDLLGKKSTIAAFIVGRPLHAMAIYDTWGAVRVNGKNLKDTVNAWWKGKDATSFSVVAA